MKKIQVSPSILSADFSKLGEDIKRLEDSGADMIHVDVMDGHFVPNLTIGPPVIKSLRKYTKLPFDVHLMIDPVHKYIKDYSDAGADIITFHPEATENISETINLIKSLNKKVGISLNPNTEISAATDYLDKIDLILIMSVYPGFGGQKFISEVIQKIKDLDQIRNERKLNFKIGKRRAGDVPSIYADNTKIVDLLKWKPKYSLADALHHAWKWEKEVQNHLNFNSYANLVA